MASTKILNGKIEKNGRSFNLIDEPWIPAVDAAGGVRVVGLRELFEKAEEFADLALGPLETIAVYRLLACVVQRALDGPNNAEEWLAARDNVADAALKYLESVKDRFDLFGEKPFLQIRGLETSGRTPTDKLDFGLASGNNGTLFDQNATPDGREHDPAWLALKLLVFQAYSPGGRIGVAKYCGKDTEGAGSSAHAPCVESTMLLTIVKGESLAESIWFNLVARDRLAKTTPLGKPVWEYDRYDSAAQKEIAASWLGRLAPISRFIELEEDGRNMILANGVSYPKLSDDAPVREPMATVFSVLNKGSVEWKYVRTDPERSPWRDLSAILALNQDKTKSGADALRNLQYWLAQSPNPKEICNIYVAGLTTDKAKIVDSAFWRFAFPSDMLGALQLAAYEDGVRLADSAESRLKFAVKAYCESLNLESQRDGLKSKTSYMARAKKSFWTALEREQHCLEDEANSKKLTKWQEIVANAMKDAYELVCPRRTARQLEAFAAGKRILYFAGKKAEKKEDANKPEKTKKAAKTSRKNKSDKKNDAAI